MTQGEKPGFDTARVHLSLLGQERELSFAVRVDRCTVRDLLGPAREISSAATAAALARAESEGRQVTCRAACGACCRQLVPISVVEAALLADVVDAMPAERQTRVRRRFADAVRALEERGLLEPGARGRQALRSSAREGRDAWIDVSRRYFAAGIACPFLEDESCSIYAERPMVCREYNVTSPPERCATLDGGAEPIARPVRMSEVLGGTAAETVGLPAGTLPLTLALEWAEAHASELEAERDGEQLFWSLLERVDAESKRPFDERE